MKYHIVIASSAGFCPGVKHAVKAATELAQSKGKEQVRLLGKLVHNDQVIAELSNKGLQTVDALASIPPQSTVLIRAHGVPPIIYDELRAKGCVIIDKTCPFVKQIQNIVRKASEEKKGVIMAGTKNHPEVIGVMGCVTTEFVVVSTVEEAEQVKSSTDNWVLVSQTTFAIEAFKEISRILSKTLENLEIFDTICATTVQRQIETRELADKCDYMLVLGSKDSSNTQKLKTICEQSLTKTSLIEQIGDLDVLVETDAFAQCTRIGVTAGASTPDRLIREVVTRMTEENGVRIPASVQTETDIDFTEAINAIPELKPGITVEGTIIRYDDDNVYVDVKGKSEGRVPRSEFETSYDLEAAAANHEPLQVYVRSIRNTDMGQEIVLSKARVDFNRHREALKEAFASKTPITVRITSEVKDGVIGVFGTVDIYIHRTQLEDLRQVKDLKPYIGQSMEVLVSQLDFDRRPPRISASRRQLVSIARKAKEKEFWDGVEVGKHYEGKVRSLTDFGAFVDLGGVDGLVHISEMSWSRIRKPSEVMNVGDEVSVYLKSFDKEKRRISLGYRRPEDDPFLNIQERFPQGSIVRGIVVGVAQMGAYIEISPGVHAFCHISQISDVRLTHPNQVLATGMEVDARVSDVSEEKRRVNLSIRDVEPINPAQTEMSATEQRPNRRGNRDKDVNAGPTHYRDEVKGSTLGAVANIGQESDSASNGKSALQALHAQLEADEAKQKEE